MAGCIFLIPNFVSTSKATSDTEQNCVSETWALGKNIDGFSLGLFQRVER